MVGNNRLANRRKVPNQTPERTRFSSGCAVVGTRSPGWAPAPAQGADRLLAPSTPSTTIYQKDLTTKEELCGKVGGGEIQSLPSPSVQGGVSSSHPLLLSTSFWR